MSSIVLISGWRDYLALCKPKIIALIVFTAVVGMFLAVPGMVPLPALAFGSLGIGLAAASAAAINHVVDQRIDSIMSRTRRRPLPSGSITEARAIVFAFALCAASMLILTFLVNTLTAVLTLVSLVGYGFIYSLYLKRATPQNIV
ncbi:MAG: UbiA family prenyltransferase, partial [Gammaproteobacteria bacterium]